MVDPLPIRILVVEDDLLIMFALKIRFENSPQFELVGDAADGETAVRLALSLKPQIVLMDINLPRMNGIEACREITSQLPETRIAIFSSHEDRLSVQNAVAAGASMFLNKDIGDDELLARLERLGSSIDKDVAEGATVKDTPPEDSPKANVS